MENMENKQLALSNDVWTVIAEFSYFEEKLKIIQLEKALYHSHIKTVIKEMIEVKKIIKDSITKDEILILLKESNVYPLCLDEELIPFINKDPKLINNVLGYLESTKNIYSIEVIATKTKLTKIFNLNLFSDLKSLDLPNQKLSDDLDLSKLYKLETINLSGNCIEKFALIGIMPNLQKLNLSYNKLKKISLNTPSLTELILSNNEFEGINFEDPKTLCRDKINKSGFEEAFMFTGIEDTLKTLNLSNNPNLKKVNIQNFKVLGRLDLSNCDILANIRLEQLPKLWQLKVPKKYLTKEKIKQYFQNFPDLLFLNGKKKDDILAKYSQSNPRKTSNGMRY